MNFKLKLHNRNISEKDLLLDLKRVANSINTRLTMVKYDKHGKYHSNTIQKRFGSFNNALKRIELNYTNIKNATKEDLYKNMEEVWTKLGRQPKYEEMKYPLSQFSVGPYHKKFGRWNQALESFVYYINSDKVEEKLDNVKSVSMENINNSIIHKTKREISDRLRFRILMRDGFACKSCGASPIKTLGLELHVDHIVPWSKGGETIPENLQTKCKKCNLGKGNAFNK